MAKRGRKATVGKAVLSFINEQKNDVKFEDILEVYSKVREEQNQKKPNPKYSKKNDHRACLSTLYILNRDGRIEEVVPKKVYASVERKHNVQQEQA
jgi:hypothetical protein